jgi:hypothetical protein
MGATPLPAQHRSSAKDVMGRRHAIPSSASTTFLKVRGSAVAIMSLACLQALDHHDRHSHLQGNHKLRHARRRYLLPRRLRAILSSGVSNILEGTRISGDHLVRAWQSRRVSPSLAEHSIPVQTSQYDSTGGDAPALKFVVRADDRMQTDFLKWRSTACN